MIQLIMETGSTENALNTEKYNLKKNWHLSSPFDCVISEDSSCDHS